MKLTHKQKKYLRKSVLNLNWDGPDRDRPKIENIAKELGVSVKDLENYIQKTWGRSKLKKLKGDIRVARSKNDYGHVLLLLTLLILACYFNSLKNDFVSDDIGTISQNPLINNLDFIRGPVLFSLRNTINFILNKTVGLNPMYFRIPNIFLHLGVSFLIFAIVSKLISKKVGTISSILFAVHPIMTESVAWVSGGPYVYGAFLFLLTLLLYIEGKSNQNNKFLVLSFFTFFLCVNIQLQFGVLALALILFEYSYGNIKENWKKLSLYILIAAGMIPIILISSSRRIQSLTLSYQRPSFTNPIYQIPVAISEYFKLFFWPKDLALYHSEMSFSTQGYLLHLTGFALFILLSIYLFKKNKKLFFWALLFLIALSPTLTPLGISWIVAERYVYIASIGLFVLFSYGLDVFLERIFPKNHKQMLVATLAILTVLLSFRTIERNFDWKNQDTLWLATDKVSPSSSQNHNNLGDYYGRQKNYEKAIQEFKKAIELQPGYADAYHNLANTYMQTGDIQSAIANYEKAIEYNPNLWQSYLNLGYIYYQEKDFAKAKEYLSRAYNINPDPGIKNALDTIK